MKSSFKRIAIYELGFAAFLLVVFLVMKSAGVTGAFAFVGWLFLVMQVFIVGPVILRALNQKLRRSGGVSPRR